MRRKRLLNAGRVVWTALVLFVLALAVTAVVVIIRGNTRKAEASPTSGTTVALKGIAFNPATLTVGKGTEVTFDNQDAVPHTVTADDGSVDSGTLGPQKAFKVKIDKPFAYHCNIHPSMKAKIELSG